MDRRVLDNAGDVGADAACDNATPGIAGCGRVVGHGAGVVDRERREIDFSAATGLILDEEVVRAGHAAGDSYSIVTADVDDGEGADVRVRGEHDRIRNGAVELVGEGAPNRQGGAAGAGGISECDYAGAKAAVGAVVHTPTVDRSAPDRQAAGESVGTVGEIERAAAAVGKATSGADAIGHDAGDGHVDRGVDDVVASGGAARASEIVAADGQASATDAVDRQGAHGVAGIGQLATEGQNTRAIERDNPVGGHADCTRQGKVVIRGATRGAEGEVATDGDRIDVGYHLGRAAGVVDGAAVDREGIADICGRAIAKRAVGSRNPYGVDVKRAGGERDASGEGVGTGEGQRAGVGLEDAAAGAPDDAGDRGVAAAADGEGVRAEGEGTGLDGEEAR